MRKLLNSFIIASFLLGGGVSFAYDEGSASHKIEESGGPSDTAVRIYQLVRNPIFGTDRDKDSTMSANDVVLWDGVSDDGVTVNLAGVAGSIDSVAGVVVSATIPTSDVQGTASANAGRRNWGYIQTYGLGSAKFGGGVGIDVAGQAIRASSVPRYFVGANQTFATGNGIFGFAYDAEGTTNNASADVFVKNR